MPEIIELISDSSVSSCKISTHGATVLSWKVNGNERIFLSKLADETNPKPGKGIRGGIPLVFPNFGPWSLGPQHGFARYKQWTIESKTDRSAKFILMSDDETEKMWPNKFQLIYNVKVTDSKLLTTLSIKNLNDGEFYDSKSFDFTCLLHTYLRVPDIKTCTISGLESSSFHNALTEKSENATNQEIKGLHENVDRNYSNTKDEHLLKFDDSCIEIRKSNLPDTVLWNPWAEKAKGMKDFGDDEYPEMVCIEAGKVADRQVLKAGDSWTCEQVLTEIKDLVELGDSDEEWDKKYNQY